MRRFGIDFFCGILLASIGGAYTPSWCAEMLLYLCMDILVNALLTPPWKGSVSFTIKPLNAKRRTNIGKSRSKSSPQIEDSLLIPSKSSLPDTIVIRRRDTKLDDDETTNLDSVSASSTDFQEIARNEVSSNIEPFWTRDARDFQSNSWISSTSPSDTSDSLLSKAKDAFVALLIADFFVVMFFLTWFLVAAGLQSSVPVLLERFQDIFQPVVVPALTLLMVGSVASGLLDKKKDE